jgi:ElaB/YqjD/DUF883 family membrane-anchored ribosome-binding protein
MKHRHQEYDLMADLERIREAFSDVARDVRGKAGEAIIHSVENVKEKSADIQDTITTYAQKKPYKTIGIALLAGAVLGWWMHRK